MVPIAPYPTSGIGLGFVFGCGFGFGFGFDFCFGFGLGLGVGPWVGFGALWWGSGGLRVAPDGSRGL